MDKWDYGGAWRRHDMSGPIALPNNSMVMAHDLTHGLPEWMKRADTVFVDPPCSLGNLRSFHTKADRDLRYPYHEFVRSLFAGLDFIGPRHLFIETFKSNHDAFLVLVRKRYANVKVYDSHYYNKPANRCWIIHASNEPIGELPIGGIDEAKAIAWICANHDYDCIGDPCMGRGLVGKHAYLNSKPFVGTELNPKRLAVLVDFIRQAAKATA